MKAVPIQLPSTGQNSKQTHTFTADNYYHALILCSTCSSTSKTRKMPSIEDRPIRAGFRRCRWPRTRHAAPLASSQLMTSKWKPTTVAINQYSQDAAVDTLVAQTIFALTLIFNPRRAVVMNRTRVECQSQSPVGSKARTETDGLTESQTRPITLPSLLTQTVKSLHFYTRSSNVKQMLQFVSGRARL